MKMGFRGWLTKLEDREELDWFKKSIKANPLAYDISYLLELEEDVSILEKGLWVAWSGDCNSSLTKYMPETYIERTIFLDDLLEKLPRFHDDPGPAKYGRVEDIECQGGIHESNLIAFDCVITDGKIETDKEFKGEL
jgi:hypothetical protein